MASTAKSLDGILQAAIADVFDLAQPGVITPRLQYTNIYTFLPTTTRTEEVQPLGAVSPDDWDTWSKTGNKAKGGIREGFLKTFTQVEHVVQMQIEKSLIQQASQNVDVLTQHLGQYRLSLDRKRESDGMSIFTNAFTAGASAGADAVALCSASHPISPHDSSTVLDNTGTAPLTYANIKAARTILRNTVDDRNQLLYQDANTIIVPNGISQEADEIINAVAKPGGADNDANASDDLRVMRLPALSDVNDWFIVDDAAMRANCRWYDGIVETIELPETTTHRLIEMRFDWSFGFIDWRWIYGNAVA